MIITKMMLHSARTGAKSILATVKIVNLGTGSTARGNYEYKIFGKRKLLKTGQISNWPRKSRSAIYLLVEVLKQAYR